MVSLLTSGVNRLPRIIVARLEHVCLTRKMFGIICCQRTCILGIIEQHAQFSDNHHLTLVSGYVRVSFLVALKAWSEIACHMSAGFHLGFTRWIGVSCSRLYRVLQVQLCVPIGFACARRIVTCGPIRVVQLVYSYCSMFFAFLIVRQLAVLMFMFLFISMCVFPVTSLDCSLFSLLPCQFRYRVQCFLIFLVFYCIGINLPFSYCVRYFYVIKVSSWSLEAVLCGVRPFGLWLCIL